VRPGRRDPSYQLPGAAEPTQLRAGECRLQPRQQLVLLLAHISLQEGHEPVEERVSVGAGGRAVEVGEQLVDGLVLVLDLQGDPLPVGQHGARHRPHHRLLRVGVREDQTGDALQDGVLLLAGGPPDVVEQLVECDVVGALAREQAAVAAELLGRLVRDGRHGTRRARGSAV
jgi:hypothetical protein